MPEIGLFHFRAHYGDYNPVDIVNFVKERAEAVIIVKEIDANRPHIHSVITEFKQTVSTFRQQLLKKFPLLADRNHSIQKKDDIEAQKRYCCKGEDKNTMPEVLYSIIDVEHYHNMYWEVNAELAGKGNMGSQKDTLPLLKAKSKTKTWSEKVFDEIIELFEPECRTIRHKYTYDWNLTDTEKTNEANARLVIFKYFMKRLGYRKLNRKNVEDMFDGMINGILQMEKVSGEKFSEEYFKNMYPNIWKLTTSPKKEMTKPDTDDDNIVLCVIEDDDNYN